MLPVTEKATLGFPPPLRSLSCLASLLPVSDILQPGLPILSRQLSRAEAVLLAFGMCRLGPLFVLFVVSSASPGPSLLLQSSARAGLSPAAPQMTHSESSLSSRSFAYPGLLALPCSVSRPEVSILVPGKCDTEPALFLQSSSYADLVVFVPASSHVDSMPSLRQMAGSGSTALLSGLSWVGFISSLPVAEFNHLGSVPSLRSSSRVGASLPACGFCHLEVFLFPRALSRPGFFVLVSSCARPGPLPAALGSKSLGFPTLLRSSGCPGLALFASGLSSCGSMLSLRSLLQLGFIALVPGMTRVGSCSSSSAADAVHPEFLLLPQSRGRAGSLLSALGLSGSGLPPALHSLSKLGFTVPAPGNARLGLISSPSVAEATCLGLSLLTRSFSWPGVIAPATAFSHSDVQMSSHNLG